MKNAFRISGVILLTILVHSCEDKPTPPTITTTDVTAISYTTATSGGNVINEGGAPIVSRGVCWNTSADPTITDNKTTESGGTGDFLSNITQLTPNTFYYVRAYSTNSAGTGYGNQVTFTTSQVEVPVLTTTAITSITQTSAVSGGNITDDKGGSVTARGVCWGTTANPTTANSKSIDGTGTGSFVSNLTELIGNTTYYVRAYATNSVGTEYGNQVSFTTSPLMPALSTVTATSVTQTTASCGGNVTDDGGAIVTARGICFSTTANPTITNNTVVSTGTTGAFTSNITGLTANTTYYVRAYATNIAGTAYGNEISFTTQPATPPVLFTSSITITQNTATCGGFITSDGAASVIARGVCWSTSPNPTISNSKTSDGSGSGSFTSNLIGLIGNSTYYVRAYAINSVGTSYGKEIFFITKGQTGTVSDIDGNTYLTIEIGTQVWMAENLKTTKYLNGDLIGTTTPATKDISGESTPKYQWACNNDENNVATYGRLYTWFAVIDSRNVCPNGWHVPTDAEWTALTTYLGRGDDKLASVSLRETGTWPWGGSNSSGFTARPGGYRSSSGKFVMELISNSHWWSSEEYDAGIARTQSMVYRTDYDFFFWKDTYRSKMDGNSVRCIED